METGASKIKNRFMTLYHAEPRRARRLEGWILSANSASPRETCWFMLVAVRGAWTAAGFYLFAFAGFAGFADFACDGVCS
jgi:hypothetical protein